MPTFNRWVIAVLTCVAALPAHAGEPQPGIAGVAGRKATVNFTDLARRKRAPRSRPERQGRSLPDAGSEEPGDRVSPREDDSMSCSAGGGRPAPLSPARRAAFRPCADDTTAIPPRHPRRGRSEPPHDGPQHAGTNSKPDRRRSEHRADDSFWASLGNRMLLTRGSYMTPTAADGSSLRPPTAIPPLPQC